jgi:hypothetical protein
MQMTSYHLRTALVFLMTMLLSFYSKHLLANDLFIGKFASETRENFGRDKYGEYEIEVVRKGEKYILSIFQDGKFQFDVEAVPCDQKMVGYLREHPPGDVYTLCNTSYGSTVFVYSQNGIKDPMAEIYKEKGIKNPRTDVYYRTQYYAQIQWGFYGFRKVQ